MHHILQWLMELLAVKCVFTGIVTVAIGQPTYVFVIAVAFTCMSLDHHRPAGYVIAVMVEVRMNYQALQIEPLQ